MEDPISPFLGRVVTIVTLGDSNTEFNHWSFGRNWVSMMGCNSHTAFKHATIINSGVSGDDVPRSTLRLERDVLRFSPDIVIVSLGTNDSFHSTVEEFRINYRHLLAILQDRGITVVARTPQPAVDMSSGREDTASQAARPKFIQSIPNLCREMGVLCIDHYAMWKRSMQSPRCGELVMLMGNSLHPNEFGHRRLYAELAPTFHLAPYFQCEFQNLLKAETPC